MSYYPLLSAPGCTGWTTLYNFAPNNWEESRQVSRHLNVTWTDGESWHSQSLDRLNPGQSRTIRAAEVANLVPSGSLPLFSLSENELPQSAKDLPNGGAPSTAHPNWRATLGLLSEAGFRTSYQGEVDPFPAPGSLLTFGHFLQFGAGIENYLLFLNIESKPAQRAGCIEIRDATSGGALKGAFEVKGNSLTCIRLDFPDTRATDLPFMVCRSMSGIPLYFSRSQGGAYLSLEHSHPPASSVVHGQRWEAHKLLKRIWFSRTGPS